MALLHSSQSKVFKIRYPTLNDWILGNNNHCSKTLILWTKSWREGKIIVYHESLLDRKQKTTCIVISDLVSDWIFHTHTLCQSLTLCSAPEMMSHLCGFWWWRVRLEVRGLLTIAIMSIFWSRGLWLPASCASCGLLGLRPEQASAYPRPPLPLIEPPPTHSWSSAPTVLPWNSHIKVLHLFVTRIANSHTHII